MVGGARVRDEILQSPSKCSYANEDKKQPRRGKQLQKIIIHTNRWWEIAFRTNENSEKFCLSLFDFSKTQLLPTGCIFVRHHIGHIFAFNSQILTYFIMYREISTRMKFQLFIHKSRCPITFVQKIWWSGNKENPSKLQFEIRHVDEV